MIYLRLEMNDSRVVYASPNVVFREGRGVLLEPGDLGYTQLKPSDPGYQAPPEPKRRRRTLSTDATFDLVQHHFQCTHHGQIAAKDKGEIAMYFMESEGGGRKFGARRRK